MKSQEKSEPKPPTLYDTACGIKDKLYAIERDVPEHAMGSYREAMGHVTALINSLYEFGRETRYAKDGAKRPSADLDRFGIS